MLLASCHRRCCICHRFCGVKMETDHICPKAEGGSDDIDNIIPVCFECHAEIHLYNPQHPRGRRFTPVELRLHRDQWLGFCKDSPHLLTRTHGTGDVGPIQAMLDELAFNAEVASRRDAKDIGCPFGTRQFDRAVSEGLLALLPDTLQGAIISAYVGMKRVNQRLATVSTQVSGSNAWATALTSCQSDLVGLFGPIQELRASLHRFLGPAG